MRSFVSCLMHCVFTTKHRQRWLIPDVRERLWPYLAGIARENDMRALAIGGVEDHVPMLVSLPATLPISKALQLLKGNSSKWIHETFPCISEFGWQGGYGAFSIGISGVDATTRYILQQEQHHRSRTFKEELVVMLKKHKIAFEPWMLEDNAEIGA